MNVLVLLFLMKCLIRIISDLQMGDRLNNKSVGLLLYIYFNIIILLLTVTAINTKKLLVFFPLLIQSSANFHPTASSPVPGKKYTLLHFKYIYILIICCKYANKEFCTIFKYKESILRSCFYQFSQ